MGWIQKYTSDFIHLFYPEVCAGCNQSLTDNENILCTECRVKAPIALPHEQGDPIMKNLFFARIEIQEATALFYYEKIGLVHNMIHKLKYGGKEQVSAFLGKWMGQSLTKNPVYQTVDIVVPVPVDPKRYKKRGYNQVDGFGRAIALELGTSFGGDVLRKIKSTKNQALLSQGRRLKSGLSLFSLSRKLPPETHVLLVDDVVTTGTTIATCAEKLLENEGIKLSVATMAVSV